MLVCPSCFGHSDVLTAHFEKHGKLGTCPTCGGEAVRLLEASELSDFFEGLREYYDPLIGDLYRLRKDGIHGIGPGSGDDSLVDILREDWEVFSEKSEEWMKYWEQNIKNRGQ